MDLFTHTEYPDERVHIQLRRSDLAILDAIIDAGRRRGRRGLTDTDALRAVVDFAPVCDGLLTLLKHVNAVGRSDDPNVKSTRIGLTGTQIEKLERAKALFHQHGVRALRDGKIIRVFMRSIDLEILRTKATLAVSPDLALLEDRGDTRSQDSRVRRRTRP